MTNSQQNLFSDGSDPDRQLAPFWPSESDWTMALQTQFESESFQKLVAYVTDQRSSHTVYPTAEDTFNAFRFSSLADTRVVILGQDPYHGPGQAHGLSFSVQSGIKIPPSLRNIYKEMATDLGCEIPAHGLSLIHI